MLIWSIVIGTLVIAPVLANKKRQKEVVRDLSGIVKGIRWRHVLYGGISAVGTLILIGLLIQVPFLQYGGYYFIHQLLNAKSGSDSTSSASTHEIFSFQPSDLAPLLIVAILIVLIPNLAKMEEETFRRKLYSASLPKKLWGSLIFGMVHLFVMVPLAAGLALTFAGLVFLYVGMPHYKKALATAEAEKIEMDKDQSSVERDIVVDSMGHLVPPSTKSAEDAGVLESTRVHTIHNYIIMTLIVFTLIIL